MNADIIKQMEDYAKDNNIPIMEKRGINFLCKFIEKNDIKSILEIGTAIGYSSIKMASVDKDIVVTSIERDQSRYLMALNNIKKCKLDKRITLILGDALNLDIEDKFDMIFIDAAKGQYIKFFEKFSKNLNSNGAIVSDNMGFHGLVDDDKKIESRNLRQLVNKIKKYIEFLKNNKKYETMFYKVGDGIAITILKEE